MNKKYILTILFIVVVCICSCQNQNTQPYSNMKIIGMQDLDSLKASYKSYPTYYVDYGNTACLFELRVNDVLVDKLNSPGNIGLTSSNINPYILHSGKQKISVKLYPNPGKTRIWIDLYPTFEPFKMKVNYIDFKLPEEDQIVIDVFEMPKLKLDPDQGGIPYFEYEGEFEAEVPYKIQGWEDCIDLRQIPDIEKRVVEEFNHVRQLMIDKKLDELKQFYALKNNEASIVLYETYNDCEDRWTEIVKSIEKARLKDWQTIEDYQLVYSADGRSVTLQSLRKNGFSSALLWIKQEEGDPSWIANSFELHLGIKKGTDKLIAIIA